MKIRVLSVTYADGHAVGEHAHGWGQLVYAGRGAIHVAAGRERWLVPPARAVWIPPGAVHCLRMMGRTALRTVYVAPDLCAGLPERCTGIDVVGLLRELVLFAVACGGLDDGVRAQAVMIEALVLMLHDARRLAFSLTLPCDARALRAVRMMEAAPGERLPLAALATGSGASVRTLQRVFLAETGMHIAQWRQAAGLLAGLACLLDGGRVTEAGFAAGYGSTSAFVSAFRGWAGVTPLVYRNGMSGGIP